MKLNSLLNKYDLANKKNGEVLELHYRKGIAKTDRKINRAFPVYGANGVLGQADKFLAESEAIIVDRKRSARSRRKAPE